MRDLEGLCAVVAACGLPYARVCFDADAPVPPLPHVLIVPDSTSDVFANGAISAKRTGYAVELYERGSSIELENALENGLEEAGFPYTRRCIPLSDGVVEMRYETQVLGR